MMSLLTFNLTENEAAQVLLLVLKCVWDPGDKDGAHKTKALHGAGAGTNNIL